MMRRLARPYAIVGWLAALVGAAGAIALRIVDPVPVIPDALGFGDPALVGFEFLGVTFASVGALLVVRRPENAVGWCMVLIGAGNALAGLTAAVTFSALPTVRRALRVALVDTVDVAVRPVSATVWLRIGSEGR